MQKPQNFLGTRSPTPAVMGADLAMELMARELMSDGILKMKISRLPIPL